MVMPWMLREGSRGQWDHPSTLISISPFPREGCYGQSEKHSPREKDDPLFTLEVSWTGEKDQEVREASQPLVSSEVNPLLWCPLSWFLKPPAEYSALSSPCHHYSKYQFPLKWQEISAKVLADNSLCHTSLHLYLNKRFLKTKAFKIQKNEWISDSRWIDAVTETDWQGNTLG